MKAEKAPLNQHQINADIALKHRLYVSGYALSGLLKQIRAGTQVGRVMLHYEDGIPVGVLVYCEYSWNQIQIFVRKSMRRKGIGSKMIKNLKPFCKELRVGRGSDASEKFWKKYNFTNYVVEKRVKK